MLAAAAEGRGGGGGAASGRSSTASSITRDPFMPDAPDVSADVPILIGWCKDEWTIFTAGEPWFGSMTEADLQTTHQAVRASPARRCWPPIATPIPTYSPTYLWVADDQCTDRCWAAEVVAVAQGRQGRARRPSLYDGLGDAGGRAARFKTPHTMEIPFMLYSFDKVRAFVGPGPGPKHMADQIAGAWVAFARTGRPDQPGIPHWPAFNASVGR